MGYQLWKSSQTGIRRKGSSFKELQSIFENTITAYHIYEPLHSCGIHDEAQEIKQLLLTKDFDVAGVLNDAGTKVIGFIRKDELEGGAIEHYMNLFNADILISNTTSIVTLFQLLTESPFKFVLANGSVEGIVTRADIDKPIIRIYIFGIISLFEMHLNYWISNEYKNESWLQLLKNNRIDRARKTYNERKGRNEALSLLECLQLCDKRSILLNNTTFLSLTKFSKTGFTSFMRKLERIRNELAHSQNSIIANLKWVELNATIQQINLFLERSEEQVERLGVPRNNTLNP